MSIVDFCDILSNPSNSIAERFNALFELRHIGGKEAIDAICANFSDKSALLKHELAYCLGQMKDSYANLKLVEVLADLSQEPMVRHEAAEGLAAIGTKEMVGILEKYMDDEAVEVAETCQIAVHTMKWLSNCNEADKKLFENIYNTVDPTPALDSNDLKRLKEIYLNANETLFDRYRAMFSLRNLNTNEASLVLCEGFSDNSALFKHEIAFVLGQLQNQITVPKLVEVLENRHENLMVRHECAEALGSIASERSLQVLKEFLNDDDIVVSESCQVALQMA